MNDNQRRRRSIGSESCMLSPILPFDLVVQILQRLPVRSLLRFKTVSKSWRSLISDSHFGKSHYDLAASPTHRYHLTIINDSELESRDMDASLRDVSAVVKLKLPRPCDKAGGDDDDSEFLGACRGLILVVFNSGKIIIWNPSTGFQRRIVGKENLGEAALNYLTGFGYDRFTDDYLLVVITPMHLDPDDPTEFERDDLRLSDYYIEFFSFRANCWSRVEGVSFPYVYIHPYSRIGSLLNDALHWLVISFETQLDVIVAFDLVDRRLSEIPVSDTLAKKLEDDQYFLRVIGECLSLYCPGNMDIKAEIWMMKEYKVQSSWSKMFVFSTCNIPRNFFFPIWLIKRGEICGSNGSGRLMILNDKGWLLDQCTFSPEPDQGQYMQADCGLYRESLISLPNDSEEEASEGDQLMISLEEKREGDQ
ncbi:F-box protein CPR1-like [Lotus japonicus]|uniref:F-box protein CPR1-like n=1 Tax=Lotus japonicus TaxID=34305 RepID=UPI00258A73F8|nr:F-box protein CPR1-like [Lotus japonicus]XP_057436183.1 F-box protein CPR1-like [Lotus japonicus]